MSEDIESFKRNLRRIAVDVANENTNARDVINNFNGWVDWVENPTLNLRTTAHGDWLRSEGARNVAHGLVRRKFTRKNNEVSESYNWLKWVGTLCAQNMVNATVNMDTDRIFPTIYTPDVLFWRTYDSRKSVADVHGLPPVQVPPTANKKNTNNNKKNNNSSSNAPESSSSESRNTDIHNESKDETGSDNNNIVGDMETEERTKLGPPEKDIDLLPKDIKLDEFIEAEQFYDFWPAGTYYAPKDTKPGWVVARAAEVDDCQTVVRMEILTENPNEPSYDLWASFENDRFHFAPMGFFTAGGNNSRNDKEGNKGTNEISNEAPTYTDILYNLTEYDANWRKSLLPSSMVDAMDKNGRWYRAIIVDTIDSNDKLSNSSSIFLPNETRTLPLIGYVRISFSGLAPGKDEWLHRCSERLSYLNFRSAGTIGTDIEIHPLAELDEERNCTGVLLTPADETELVADRLLTPCTLQKGSSLVHALAEFFGSVIGVRYKAHTALHARLLTSGSGNEPHLPLIFWVEWAPVLGKLVDVFTQQGIEYIIVPFVDALVRWVKNGMSGEEMRALTKEQVDQLHVAILRLTRAYSTVEVSSGIACDIVLGIVERWLKIENTAKRRDALKLLQELTEYATNYEMWPLGIARHETINKNGQTVIEYTRVPYVRGITVTQLANWISERNVVRDIFNTRHHSELVRNAGHILRILADSNILTTNDIKDIWVACEYTAIEDVQPVVSMLVETVPLLSPLIAKQLFEFMLNAGGTKFPEQTSRLLQTFALSQENSSSLPLESQEKLMDNSTNGILNVRRALAALYALALGIPMNHVANLILSTSSSGHESSTTSKSIEETKTKKDISFGSSGPTMTAVSDAAQTALLEALRDKRLAPYRLPYARLCLRNIQSYCYLTRSLVILRGIIESYPTFTIMAAANAAVTVNSTNGNKKITPTFVSAAVTTEPLQLPANLLPPSLTSPSSTVSSGSTKESKTTPNCTYTAADITVFVESLKSNNEKATLLGLDMTKPAIQAALILLGKDPSLSTTMKITGTNVGAVVRKAAEQLATFNTLLNAGIMNVVETVSKPSTNSKGKSSTDNNVPDGPYLAETVDLLQKELNIADIFVKAVMEFSKRGQRMAQSMNMHTWSDIHSDSKVANEESKMNHNLRDSSIVEATALLDDTHVTIVNSEGLSNLTVSSSSAIESSSKEMTIALRILGYDPLLVQSKIDRSCTTVPFGTGIKLLLETMGYVAASSNITFTKEQVVNIWDTCITNAITNTQRTIGLAWFLHGVSSLSRIEGPRPSPADVTLPSLSSSLGLLFHNDTAVYLFLERINTPAFTDGTSIDHTGFVTWRAYFIYHAGHQGAIQHGGTRLDDIGAGPDAPKTTSAAVNALGFLSPDPPLWAAQVPVTDTSLRRISDIEVVGMDALWLLTLQATDSEVAGDAVHLLTTLQQRVSDSLTPRVAEFRRSYVRRCMQYIQNVLQNYQGETTIVNYGWPWDGSGEEDEGITGKTPSGNTPTRSVSSLSTTGSTVFRTTTGTSDSSSRSSFGRPAQLVDRCISLLESLLDESEEEMASIFEALRWLIAQLTTVLSYSSSPVRNEFHKFSDLSQLLTVAREILTYSSHALDACTYLESVPTDNDLQLVPTSPKATARLLASLPATQSVNYTEAAVQLDPDRTCTLRINFMNVTLPVISLPLPSSKSAAVPSSESKDATDSKESKEDLPTVSLPPPPPPLRLHGQMNVVAGVHERVRDIVSMIAGMTGLPSRCLRIRFPLASIKDPRGAMLGRTLAEIGQNQSVFITVAPEPVEAMDLQRVAFAHTLGDVSTPGGMVASLRRLLKRAQSMPARLLASETEGFGTLFSLLDLAITKDSVKGTSLIPSSTAAKVWRMLCRLPTSPQYLHAMLDTIGGGGSKNPDYWLLLLPTTSYSRFLYGTLLVRRLVTPSRLWIGEGILDTVAKSGILRYQPMKKRTAEEQQKEVTILQRILGMENHWRTVWVNDITKGIGNGSSLPNSSGPTTDINNSIVYPVDADTEPALEHWRMRLTENKALNHIFKELLRTLTVSPTIKDTEASMVSSLRFVTLAITQRFLVPALLQKHRLQNHTFSFLLPRERDANIPVYNYTGALQALTASNSSSSIAIETFLVTPKVSRKPNPMNLALEFQLQGMDESFVHPIVQSVPVDTFQTAILQFLYHEILIKQVNQGSVPSTIHGIRLRIDQQSILRCLYVWATIVITHANLWSIATEWVPDTRKLTNVIHHSPPVTATFLRLLLVLLLGPTVSNAKGTVSTDHPNIGEDNSTLALQCATAVVLQTVCNNTPTLNNLSPGHLSTVTIDGKIHPHRWLLDALLEHRPTHASVRTMGNLSTYYTLTESLLRDVIDTLIIPETSTIPPNELSVVGHGARSPRVQLPVHLRILLKKLLESIAACPVMETMSSVAEANKTVQQRALNQADTTDDEELALTLSIQSGTVEGPLPPPPPSAESGTDTEAISSMEVDDSTNEAKSSTVLSQVPSPVTHTVDFAKRYLSSLRNTQLNRIRPLYSVIPMHPAFMSLGKAISDEAVRKAFYTMVNAHPESTPLTSPKSLENVPGAATEIETVMHELVRNISLEPVASPDDIVSPVNGVDHILIGTLQLATVLVEMDPVTARELAKEVILLPSSHTSKTIIEVLFHDCLFVDDSAHLVQSPVGSSSSSSSSSSFSPSIVRTNSVPKSSPNAPPITYHPLVLLAGSPPTGPKCKSILARRAVFQLLTAFIRRSPHTMVTILQILENQASQLYDSENPMHRLDTISKYGYKQNPLMLEGRSAAGYVGLRNLGATCYMNSLLQQFFMMEPLRFGILSVLSTPEAAKDTLSIGALVEERKSSVLYQLQRIFGHLEISDRRAYEPRDWTQAFKDWEGNPINVGEQQDAQEFLNMFLDKIENELKPTSRAKLLQQILGLETREITYCTGGCGTVRVNQSPNMCCSVEVSTGEMTSALDRLVAWEDIHGYECVQCKTRTTLRKRMCLGELGNTLILHLKRFSMDWEIMQPVKQNTRFEFPTSINFQPFSYDVIARELTSKDSTTTLPVLPQDSPRDNWEYELVGVVVHSGELTHGHYYSFIKERGLRADALMAERKGMESVNQFGIREDKTVSSNGRWLEFNDSVVREWDITKLEEECFGGVISQKNASLSSGNNNDITISRNAYMLVYERKKPLPLPVEIDHTEAELYHSLLGLSYSGWVPTDNTASSTTISSPSSPTTTKSNTVMNFTFGKHVSTSSSSPTTGDATVTGRTSSVPTKQKVSLSPHQLVPRDAYGRGILPSSIAAEIVADNGVFGRLYRQMDNEFASFMHSIVDTVGRQATLLSHSSATPLAVPLVFLDDDEILTTTAGTTKTGTHQETKKEQGLLIDFRTLFRPLFMFGVLPLARSNNTVLVPHYMYGLCRLIGMSKEITELVGLEFQDIENHSRTKQDKKKEKLVPKLRTLSGRLILDEYNLHHDSWYRTIVLQGAPDVVRYAVARVFAMTLITLLQSDLPNFRPQPFRAIKGINSRYRLPGNINGTNTLLGNLLNLWMGTVELFDYCATFAWRFFDPHFTALYDAARGGFGSGLPLQLHIDSVSSFPIPVYSTGGAGVYRALCRWSDGLPEHRITYEVIKALHSFPDYKVLDITSYGIATYYRFMVLGHRMRHAYIDRIGLLLLFDLYLQDNTVSWTNPRKREAMCNKLFTPTWTRMFDLMNLLWRSCYMPNYASNWPGAVSPFAVYLGPVRSVEHAPLLHFLPYAHNLLVSSSSLSSSVGSSTSSSNSNVGSSSNVSTDTTKSTTRSISSIIMHHLSYTQGRRSSTGGPLGASSMGNTSNTTVNASASSNAAAALVHTFTMEHRNTASESAYVAVQNGSTDAQIMCTYWKGIQNSWSSPLNIQVPLGPEGRLYPIPPLPDPCFISPQVLPSFSSIFTSQSAYDLEIQRLQAGVPNQYVTNLVKARNEFKQTNPSLPVPNKFSIALAGLTLSAPDVNELTDRPIELEMHREQTLAIDTKYDPSGRLHTLALDSSAPEEYQNDIYRFLVKNRNLYAILLNKVGTSRSGPWPDMWGPNPDAVAGIIGHRFAGLKRWNDKEKDFNEQFFFIRKTMDTVIRQNYNADFMHFIFMVMETLALQHDVPEVRNNRINEFVHLLYSFMEDAVQEKYTPVALEYANELIRLFILSERALDYLFEYDLNHYQSQMQKFQQLHNGGVPVNPNSIVNPPRGSLYQRHVIESTIVSALMDIEQEGRNRVFGWQLAAVDPHCSLTDSEILASATAGASLPGSSNKTLSASEAREIPYRRYMTKLLTGNITNLSHRDEVMLINQSNINPCLRATIALQRMERALEARGYTMLTKAQIEDIRKQRQEEIALANSQSTSSNANSGGGGSNRNKK